MDKNIRRLGIFYAALIVALVINLTWLQVMDNNRLTANPNNRRLLVEEYGIQRGRILTEDGVLLAESREGTGDIKYTRFYPQGTLYDHIVGYDSPQLGRTAIEAQYNDYLLAKDKVLTTLQRLTRTRKEGYDVTLTVESKVQEAAAAALGERRGAVVAMNPRTGAVLAMVSWPDFDPNSLVSQDLVQVATTGGEVAMTAGEAAMQGYSNDPSAPLLDRVTQGLYRPGSTFKVVTAAAAIDGAGIPTSRTYDCPGTMIIGGARMSNYDGNSFGEIDMETAMTYSVNTYFAQLAVDTGGQTMVKYAESGGMNQVIPLDLPDVSRSTIPQAWQMDTAGLAATGYGQGNELVTPLQMCLFGCAIANGGAIMYPHLLKDVRDRENIVDKYETREWRKMMSPESASTVLSMMRQVVAEGTGKAAAVPGHSVAGKTGTAEVEGQKDYTWFVGIADVQNPQIVVAVVVEASGGGGGTVAAPIARQVMAAALQ